MVGPSSLQLPYEHPERMVDVGEGLSLDIAVLNYGKWIKKVGAFGFICTANAHFESFSMLYLTVPQNLQLKM